MYITLYYILITTSMSLATDNPIYAIVAIGFLLPAEKLLRKFFGFHNDETMGAMNSAIGGALIYQGINWLGNMGKRKSIQSKTSKSNEQDEEEYFEEPVRTMDTSFLTGALGGTLPVAIQGGVTPKQQSAKYDGSQEKERLEELESQGFAEGDEEYDRAKAQYKKYKGALNSEPPKPSVEGESMPTSSTTIPKVEPKDKTKKADKPHYLRGAGTLAGKFIAKSAKTGARLALRGTLAGTAAMIGVAGGLATGDYDKALSYGIAGAVAGGYAGGRVADGLQKLPSNAYRKVDKVVTDAKQTFRQSAYTPEQYKQKMIEESNNRFMNSKKYQEMYKQRYGKQYKQAMEEATAYRNQGVMDDKLIMRAMDLKAAGFDANNRADPKRIAAAKLASGVSNEKDIESVEKRLKELGIDENQIRLQKDAIRKLNNLV